MHIGMREKQQQSVHARPELLSENNAFLLTCLEFDVPRISSSVMDSSLAISSSEKEQQNFHLKYKLLQEFCEDLKSQLNESEDLLQKTRHSNDEISNGK